MFKIGKIETGEFYINRAMDSMQEFATKQREEIDRRFKKMEEKKDKLPEVIRLDKRKDLELEKIRYLNSGINSTLRKVSKQFPNFLKVSKIYQELINTSEVPVKRIKECQSELNGITNRIDELTQNTEWKIKKARTQETVGFLMKKYLGKVNSYFSKNHKIFSDLERSRNFINRLPEFKDIYTVAIAGFPNVGKSTLMKKMTGSDVEIQNYPFTTKGLMFGYIVEKEKTLIQLIDTPGLLGRSKNNNIEQRAEIVLHESCDLVVFVLDFTQSCGYPIEQQLALLKNTAKIGKEMVLYLSKTDIFDEDSEYLIEENKIAIKKYKQFTDSNKLKDYLIDLQKKNKKFDIKEIGLIK